MPPVKPKVNRIYMHAENCTHLVARGSGGEVDEKEAHVVVFFLLTSIQL